MAGDSAESPVLGRLSSVDPRFERATTAVTRVCFGDRGGLTVFVGAMAFLVLVWRFGTFFNDIGLFVPALERLSAGHLSLGRPTELDGFYPGMHIADGQVYARNYGQIALSLPVLWALEAGDAVLDLRWAIVVGWSVLVAATGALVGERVGLPRRGLAAGTAVGVVAFAANAWFYKPLLTPLAVVALQLTTMLAAAFTGVFVYRLLARRHGTTVGLLAGGTTVLATPVAFWAIAPKRHALSAFVVVLVVYAFARSREPAAAPDETGADDPDRGTALATARRRQTGFRALAYASTGFLAWVHAPEGFTLFLALAVVDVPTAPRNDPRTLAVVGAAFALSLVPFFLTNALISGNPLLPPRFVETFRPAEFPVPDPDPAGTPGGDGGAGAGGSDGGGQSGTGGSSTGGGSTGIVGTLVGLVGTLVGLVGVLASNATDVVGDLQSVLPLLERGVGMYTGGLEALVADPPRAVDVFVRWGRKEYTPRNVFFDGATNLSVLESAPVAAALVALPLRRRVRELRTRTRSVRETVDPVDALVVLFAVLLVGLFAFRLPVHVQATVRYLHPLYPLLVYGAFRQPRVRRALTAHTRPALLSYEATTLLGTPVALWAILRFDASKGDVAQTYGLVALVVAAWLAGSLVAGAFDDRADPVAAVAFGVAAGLATVYLLVTAFVIMHFGPSALPFFETVSGEYRFRTLVG